MTQTTGTENYGSWGWTNGRLWCTECNGRLMITCCNDQDCWECDGEGKRMCQTCER